MSPERLTLVGYVAIVLQCLIVGLLIWHRYFGCYSAKHQAQEEERITKLVVRQLYRIRQEDTLRSLDHLLRDVKPDDFREDCA